MCTAITLKTSQDTYLFGRTLDLEYSFNQEIIFVPRNFRFNKPPLVAEPKYAILGMATKFNGFPLFADAFNEEGLGVAGLNFPKYAVYSKKNLPNKNNVDIFNFPLWLLSNFKTIQEARTSLTNINLVDTQLDENFPNSPLHFIITDKTGETIVLEQTKGNSRIFDNPYGVLTNSPDFLWQRINLSQYVNLIPKQILNLQGTAINALSNGTGLLGLPGDFTAPSRFVRAALFREFAQKNSVDINEATFFQILANVSIPKGALITSQGDIDYTQYTSCMDLNRGIYYYKTYNSQAVYQVNLHAQNKNETRIVSFPYNNEFITIKL